MNAGSALLKYPEHKKTLAIGMSVMLAGLGTSALDAIPINSLSMPFQMESTNAGIPSTRSRQSANHLAELRRLSGLTWEELAELFQVSRRAVHFWASGKPLSFQNEQRLERTLATLRKIQQETPRKTRSELLRLRERGVRALDLLARDETDRVFQVMPRGETELRAPVAKKRPQGAAMRAADLVDARQERVHVEVGRARVAKTTRIVRKG